jgi:hypothetical protein
MVLPLLDFEKKKNAKITNNNPVRIDATLWSNSTHNTHSSKKIIPRIVALLAKFSIKFQDSLL